MHRGLIAQRVDRRGSDARHLMWRVLAPVVVSTAIACSSLLEVETPTQITEAALQNPANARLIVNGARSDFECAFGAYIVAFGLLSDEFESSGGAAIFFDYDRRTMDPLSGLYSFGSCLASQTQLGTYRPVSTARYTADNALTLLNGWTDEEVPGRVGLIALANAYGGYSRILLGEGHCSAAIDGGPELTPAQIFAQAEERFTAAITSATTAGDASLVSMALLGRARARLNQGKLAEAAADARLIPAGFVYNANYNAATARSQNQLVNLHFRASGMIVEAGYRNLTFGGVADPRVPVEDAGRPSGDGLRPLWLTSKYALQGSPIPLASWEEAQLIIAEAEVAVNNLPAAVSAINALHAKVNLPPYAGGTAAEVRDQVIEERRRELFAESHRAWDRIRFNLPLLPPVGATHPQGGTYGSQKCLPMPDVERNSNPNS